MITSAGFIYGFEYNFKGLTPTKLILASDFLEDDDNDVYPGVDPEISTLELLSMFPVECVNMSVFRRKTRNTLKAHLCNEQILYFELASPLRRDMYWSLWCERVNFLTPDLPKSIESETSVGSSSSSSTCYGNKSLTGNSWQERDLFLGNKFGQDLDRVKSRKLPLGEPHIPREMATSKTPFDKLTCSSASVQVVNRFGAGINENCKTNLFLPAHAYSLPGSDDVEAEILNDMNTEVQHDVYWMMEDSVHLWEKKSLMEKHLRRKGLAPMGYHFWGLGNIHISKHDAYSVQIKRSSSEIFLQKRDDKCPEFEYDIPKRQLISSISYDCLLESEDTEFSEELPIRGDCSYYYQQGQTLFWTPNFFYFPIPAWKSFRNLKLCLKGIHEYQTIIGAKKKLSIWSKIKRNYTLNQDCKRKESSSTIRKFRRELKMDIKLSSWDFDSTTLAYQLTLIDRDFFLKIDSSELLTVLQERNSLNSPNIRAMMLFAERMANLIATEIVRVDSVKMRARLISKYVNVADKLHRLHNMHSTKTVLMALQSPALYRLKKTWQCLREHHASKYQRLFTLLKVYKETRSYLFCQLFEKFSLTPPYIPAIQHLIAGLFGHLPKIDNLLPIASYSSLHQNGYDKSFYNPWAVQSKSSVNSDSSINRNSRASYETEQGMLNHMHAAPYIQPLLEANLGIYERMENSKNSLIIWQQAATKYDLIENPLVKEFLLKSRYSEGYELFLMSLNIEPHDCLKSNSGS